MRGKTIVNYYVDRAAHRILSARTDKQHTHTKRTWMRLLEPTHTHTRSRTQIMRAPNKMVGKPSACANIYALFSAAAAVIHRVLCAMFMRANTTDDDERTRVHTHTRTRTHIAMRALKREICAALSGAPIGDDRTDGRPFC